MPDDNAGLSFFNERREKARLRLRSRKAKVSREERIEAEKQRQADFELAFSKLKVLQPMIEAGNRAVHKEWLDTASFLIDGFRETRQLFPTDGVRRTVLFDCK